jgi:hypothetical protein
MLLLFSMACKPGTGVVSDNDKPNDIPYDTSDSMLNTDCDEPEIVEWNVRFEQPDQLRDWGEDGNQSATQGEHSARYEQVQFYNSERTICDVSVPLSISSGGVNSSSFLYDDHIILTFNERVLFSSSQEIISYLSEDDISFVWDWNKIVGTTMDATLDAWWVGNSEVSLPYPNEIGTMSVGIDDSAIDALIAESIASNQLSFSLITLGDNDSSDCYHNGVSFTIELALGQ